MKHICLSLRWLTTEPRWRCLHQHQLERTYSTVPHARGAAAEARARPDLKKGNIRVEQRVQRRRGHRQVCRAELIWNEENRGRNALRLETCVQLGIRRSLQLARFVEVNDPVHDPKI